MTTRGRGGNSGRAWAWSRARCGLLCLLAALLFCASAPAAHALKSIAVANDLDRVEITALGEAYEGRGDVLQIETAPSADGLTGRMSVRATTPGTNPAWFAFALTNTTGQPIERRLASEPSAMR